MSSIQSKRVIGSCYNQLQTLIASQNINPNNSMIYQSKTLTEPESNEKNIFFPAINHDQMSKGKKINGTVIDYSIGKVMNKLAHKLPNIAITYGYFPSEKMILIEEDNSTLTFFDYIHSNEFNNRTAMEIILQITLFLQKAQEKFGFIHHSLTVKNVLLINNNKKIEYNIDNHTYIIECKYTARVLFLNDSPSTVRLRYNEFPLSQHHDPVEYSSSKDLITLLTSGLAASSEAPEETYNFWYKASGFLQNWFQISRGVKYIQLMIENSNFELPLGNKLTYLSPKVFLKWILDQQSSSENIIQIIPRGLKTCSEKAKNKIVNNVDITNYKSNIIKGYNMLNSNDDHDLKNLKISIYDLQLAETYITILNMIQIPSLPIIEINFPIEYYLARIKTLPSLREKYRIICSSILFLRYVETLIASKKLSNEAQTKLKKILNLFIIDEKAVTGPLLSQLFNLKKKIRLQTIMLTEIINAHIFMLTKTIDNANNYSESPSVLLSLLNINQIYQDPSIPTIVIYFLDTFLSKLPTIFTFNYYPPWSLLQIFTIIQENEEEVIKVLQSGTGSKDINLQGNDLEIYKNLYLQRDTFRPDNTSQKRYNTINRLLLQKMLIDIPDRKDWKIIDFNTINDQFALLCAENLVLNKNNITVVEIDQDFSNNNHKQSDQINYVKININQNLPFEDKSIDLITLFTLESLNDRFLPELRRICRGYLVIGAHDCDDNYDRMLIDIETLSYKLMRQNESFSILNKFQQTYHNRDQWVEILAANEFVTRSFVDTFNEEFELEYKGSTRKYLELFV